MSTAPFISPTVPSAYILEAKDVLGGTKILEATCNVNKEMGLTTPGDYVREYVHRHLGVVLGTKIALTMDLDARFVKSEHALENTHNMTKYQGRVAVMPEEDYQWLCNFVDTVSRIMIDSQFGTEISGERP